MKKIIIIVSMAALFFSCNNGEVVEPEVELHYYEITFDYPCEGPNC